MVLGIYSLFWHFFSKNTQIISKNCQIQMRHTVLYLMLFSLSIEFHCQLEDHQHWLVIFSNPFLGMFDRDLWLLRDISFSYRLILGFFNGSQESAGDPKNWPIESEIDGRVSILTTLLSIDIDESKFWRGLYKYRIDSKSTYSYKYIADSVVGWKISKISIKYLPIFDNLKVTIIWNNTWHFTSLFSFINDFFS